MTLDIEEIWNHTVHTNGMLSLKASLGSLDPLLLATIHVCTGGEHQGAPDRVGSQTREPVAVKSLSPNGKSGKHLNVRNRIRASTRSCLSSAPAVERAHKPTS